MKKFLSAFLAILMVLSMVATSLVTVFAADGAEEVKSVLVSNGEDINPDQSKNGASQAGWRNHKAYISLMNGAAGMKIAEGKPATDLRFHYFAKETVDLTKFSYVEFDLYVSDIAAFAGVNHFALELTSISKEDDGNESQFLWDDLSALKTGWNHVKFPLSSFAVTGTFDATKWNFVRLFAADGAAWPQEFVVAIDNFGFSDGTETPAEATNEIALPSADTTVLGWEVMPEKWNMNFDLETPDKSNACLIRTWAEGSYATNGVNMFWIIENGDGTCKNFDVSTADSFAIDVWLSDATLFTGKSFQIELGNGGFGAIDTNEATYNGALDALVEGGLKTGWNTVVLPFTSTTATGNGADWTKIDWFRMYNNDTITAGADGMQMAIDNVRFVKGEDVVAVMSTCEPSTNGWSASFVEIKDSVVFGKTTAADKFAICDIYWDYTMAVGYDVTNMKYIEYDLYISNVEAIKDVTLYMEMTSSGIYDQQESGRNVKIGDMGLKNGWNHVKFELANLSDTANSGTAGGTLNRANFNYFRLYTIDEVNLTAAVTVAFDNVRVTDATDPACENCQVVHAIDLPMPGTTVAGWSWAPSFTNKAQGSASVLSVLEANKTYAPASSGKVIEAFKPGAAGAVDASEADSFVFEFYVSNAEVLKALNVELELSSNPNGGDQNEMRYVNGNLDSKIEGGMKDGWNTVVIPKTALASGSDHLSDEALKVIDWTKISYFRMYFLGNIVTGDEGLVYGFDNLRFTKDGEVVATLADCEPDMSGWGAGTPLFAMGDDLVMGKTVNGKFDVCDVYYEYVAAEAFDITEMKYLEFDFYLSNAKALKNVNWTIELTSAGASDHNEIGTTKSFNDFVNGWNHIKIDLSTLADTAGAGACDKTAVNFFRMFTIDVVEGIGELTFALTNVRITDGEAAPLETPEAPDDPKPPVDDDAALDAEEATKTETCVPLFGANTTWGEGWVVDKEDKKAGSGSLSLNLNGKTGNVITPVMFENKIDATGMTTLEFSIYLSDLGILDHLGKLPDGQLEIFSGAEPDQEEKSIRVIILMQLLKEQNAKVGWNDVSIDLRSLDPVGGDLALDRIAGIRFYFVGLEDCGQDWTIKIDNIRLTKAVEPELPEGTKEDEYIFELFSEEEKKYLDPDYPGNNQNNQVRFADNAQYFIYKYDLKSFRGVKSINFEANLGGQLHLWASADGKVWVEIEKHEVRFDARYMNIDLSVMAEAVALTGKLYIKIGDANAATANDGNGGQIRAGEAHLTVVYDANANQDPIVPVGPQPEFEKIVFRVETEAEKPYLFENTAKWNNQHRYGDKDAYYTYKYSVKNVHQIIGVIWKAKTCQEFKLDISFDNKNWQTVSSTEENTAPLMRQYDLTSFLVGEDGNMKVDTFYLKICDADTSDGWGGGIWGDADVTLSVEYTPLTDEQKDALEMTATEHSIPLWGANKTWGHGWENDNENMLAGSGCITINLNGKTGTCAPSKEFEPVDASNMDSVEFDIYISHLEILDHLANCGGSLELTSSGTCDYQEKNYGIKNIAQHLKDQGAVIGWNHIVIPLDEMAPTDNGGDPNKADIAGPFDKSRINYIRFFWTDMTNCEQDWIIKLDNFRMTDAQAEADRIAAEYEAKVLEDNKGLITNLEALKTIYEGELTKDNISAAEAKYGAAKTSFEKLETAAQDVLRNKGYFQHLSKAKKAIDEYKEVEQILKDNAKLIADLEALAAYKDASAFTNENYDAAKAAIKAARDAVDALTKTQKDALADAIAHLTAAEAAMPAEKPEAPKTECTEHADADADGKCDNCGADVATGNGGGCKSALTIGAVATMILAGAWVTIAARKKED